MEMESRVRRSQPGYNRPEVATLSRQRGRSFLARTFDATSTPRAPTFGEQLQQILFTDRYDGPPLRSGQQLLAEPRPSGPATIVFNAFGYEQLETE